MANPSTSAAFDSHLEDPFVSKPSKARRADAEVSGMERVAFSEEDRGVVTVEPRRARKKGEWKSRRSELTQILAPPWTTMVAVLPYKPLSRESKACCSTARC